MFVFPSGSNSLPKVYVLNTIIVSPVLSWPLVARQPRLPKGHSSSLCIAAHGRCTTQWGWKASTSPSKVIANESLWHTALSTSNLIRQIRQNTCSMFVTRRTWREGRGLNETVFCTLFGCCDLMNVIAGFICSCETEGFWSCEERKRLWSIKIDLPRTVFKSGLSNYSTHTTTFPWLQPTKPN